LSCFRGGGHSGEIKVRLTRVVVGVETNVLRRLTFLVGFALTF
jgi:hypothetical protein